MLNAYLDRDYVVAVMRGEDGGIIRRNWPAPHLVEVRDADLPPGYATKLARHPAVTGIERTADGWVRARFQHWEDARAFCAAADAQEVQTYNGLVNAVLRWSVEQDIVIERPRMAWLDIETDSRATFTAAIAGDARVLCWSLVLPGGREEQATLGADTDGQERALLGALWEALDGADLVLAWNGDRFDFPIIKERSRRRGLYSGGTDPRRWLWLDHLELFWRMNMMASESGEEKQSLALNSVAQAVLGRGKAEFDASKTWEAWLAGGAERERLAAYCLQDTQLMPAIEAKTGYVELLVTLCETCGVFPDSRGINPQVQTDGYLSRLAEPRGHRFPTKLQRRPNLKYKGAYVMEPLATGVLREVHVADFAGLYPSIIRTWNMSAETIVEEGGALSPLTGIRFSQERPGILPDAVAELMRLRTEWNRRKAAATPGTQEWKEADRRSTAYKIAANSFYGVVGAATSRHCEPRVAESVSQCAVWLLKATIEEAKRVGYSVLYADTDSVFVQGPGSEEFARFVESCNAELYPRMLAEVGCGANLIKLAYEKAFDRLVFVSAKKYAGAYLHYKGTAATADSKPEVKGLEYKRGDAVRLARQLQEEVIAGLLGYCMDPIEDVREYETLLAGWRERVMHGKLALEDVVVSKRLSKSLDDYERRVRRDGTLAREPAHVRIARELDARGRDVRQGAKVEYYLAEDGSGEYVEVDPAEDWAGRTDRAMLWTKYVGPPTIRLLESAFPGHGWQHWLDAGIQVGIDFK